MRRRSSDFPLILVRTERTLATVEERKETNDKVEENELVLLGLPCVRGLSLTSALSSFRFSL